MRSLRPIAARECRAARRRAGVVVAVEAGDDDRDRARSPSPSPRRSRPSRPCAGRRRARPVAAFSASPPRPSTRLAVRAALAAWSTVQVDEHQLPDHQRGQQQPPEHRRRARRTPGRALRAAAVAHSRLAGLSGVSGEPAGGSSSITVSAVDADLPAASATPGSAPGPCSCTRDRHVVGLVDLRALRASPSAGPRPPPLRYGGSLPGVGRVDRELARALARGVAGGDVRVADRARSATARRRRSAERQQAHELDASPGRARRRGGPAGRAARRRGAPASSSCGHDLELVGQRLERAAQLAVLHARRRARVDRGLERAEVGGDRRLRHRVADDLAREVGLDLAPARGPVEQRPMSSSSRTLSRLHRSRIRRTPRSASTSGVVTTSTWLAISARDRGRLGDDGADVDDGQRVARLDGAEHVAGDGGVDVLGALALARARAAARKPSLCVYSVSCRWRTEISSATSTRSTTLRRYGVSSSARKSPFWRSKSTRQTGRPGAIRAAARPRCSATVVVPTPPLAPATAISWPPSAPRPTPRRSRGRASSRDHCEAARTLASKLTRATAAAPRRRGCRPASRRASAPASPSAASRTSPTSGKRGRELAGELEHGHAAERVVQQRRRRRRAGAARACSSSGSATRVDDLELVALARPARPRGGQSRRRRRRSAAAGSLARPRAAVHRAARPPSVGSASPGRSSARRTSAANDSAWVTVSSCSGVERERDRHDLRRVGGLRPGRRCRP